MKIPVRAGDVPKRCQACSKGVGIALRNWSGLAKAILGLFFLLKLHSGRAVADDARLARVVRGQNRRDRAATRRA